MQIRWRQCLSYESSTSCYFYLDIVNLKNAVDCCCQAHTLLALVDWISVPSECLAHYWCQQPLRPSRGWHRWRSTAIQSTARKHIPRPQTAEWSMLYNSCCYYSTIRSTMCCIIAIWPWSLLPGSRIAAMVARPLPSAWWPRPDKRRELIIAGRRNAVIVAGWLVLVRRPQLFAILVAQRWRWCGPYFWHCRSKHRSSRRKELFLCMIVITAVCITLCACRRIVAIIIRVI